MTLALSHPFLPHNHSISLTLSHTLALSRSLSPKPKGKQPLALSHSLALLLARSRLSPWLALALSQGPISLTENPCPRPHLQVAGDKGGDGGKFPHGGRDGEPPPASPRPVANPSLHIKLHILSSDALSDLMITCIVMLASILED